MKLAIINTVLIATIFSCGKTDKKVQITNSSSKADGTADPLANLSDPNCSSKAQCNDVTFTVVDEMGTSFFNSAAPSTSAPQKTSTVGAAVSWKLIVNITSGAPTGRVMLAPRDTPTWMKVENGTEAGTKLLSGSPTANAANTTMTFVARDMLKCKFSNESGVNGCLDGAQNLPYDKLVTIKYTITGGVPGSGGNILPQNCVQTGVASNPVTGIMTGIASSFIPGIGGVINPSSNFQQTCY